MFADGKEEVGEKAYFVCVHMSRHTKSFEEGSEEGRIFLGSKKGKERWIRVQKSEKNLWMIPWFSELFAQGNNLFKNDKFESLDTFEECLPIFIQWIYFAVFANISADLSSPSRHHVWIFSVSCITRRHFGIVSLAMQLQPDQMSGISWKP